MGFYGDMIYYLPTGTANDVKDKIIAPRKLDREYVGYSHFSNIVVDNQKFTTISNLETLSKILSSFNCNKKVIYLVLDDDIADEKTVLEPGIYLAFQETPFEYDIYNENLNTSQLIQDYNNDNGSKRWKLLSLKNHNIYSYQSKTSFVSVVKNVQAKIDQVSYLNNLYQLFKPILNTATEFYFSILNVTRALSYKNTTIPIGSYMLFGWVYDNKKYFYLQNLVLPGECFQLTYSQDSTNLLTMEQILIDGKNLIQGTVGTGQLAGGAVTSEKIAAGAVTNTKIGAGAVTNAKIGNNAVESHHISSGAIEMNHMQQKYQTTYNLGILNNFTLAKLFNSTLFTNLSQEQLNVTEIFTFSIENNNTFELGIGEFILYKAKKDCSVWYVINLTTSENWQINITVTASSKKYKNYIPTNWNSTYIEATKASDLFDIKPINLGKNSQIATVKIISNSNIQNWNTHSNIVPQLGTYLVYCEQGKELTAYHLISGQVSYRLIMKSNTDLDITYFYPELPENFIKPENLDRDYVEIKFSGIGNTTAYSLAQTIEDFIQNNYLDKLITFNQRAGFVLGEGRYLAWATDYHFDTGKGAKGASWAFFNITTQEFWTVTYNLETGVTTHFSNQWNNRAINIETATDLRQLNPAFYNKNLQRPELTMVYLKSELDYTLWNNEDSTKINRENCPDEGYYFITCIRTASKAYTYYMHSLTGQYYKTMINSTGTRYTTVKIDPKLESVEDGTISPNKLDRAYQEVIFDPIWPTKEMIADMNDKEYIYWLYPMINTIDEGYYKKIIRTKIQTKNRQDGIELDQEFELGDGDYLIWTNDYDSDIAGSWTFFNTTTMSFWSVHRNAYGQITYSLPEPNIEKGSISDAQLQEKYLKIVQNGPREQFDNADLMTILWQANALFKNQNGLYIFEVSNKLSVDESNITNSLEKYRNYGTGIFYLFTNAYNVLDDMGEYFLINITTGKAWSISTIQQFIRSVRNIKNDYLEKENLSVEDLIYFFPIEQGVVSGYINVIDSKSSNWNSEIDSSGVGVAVGEYHLQGVRKKNKILYTLTSLDNRNDNYIISYENSQYSTWITKIGANVKTITNVSDLFWTIETSRANQQAHFYLIYLTPGETWNTNNPDDTIPQEGVYIAFKHSHTENIVYLIGANQECYQIKQTQDQKYLTEQVTLDGNIIDNYSIADIKLKEKYLKVARYADDVAPTTLSDISTILKDSYNNTRTLVMFSLYGNATERENSDAAINNGLTVGTYQAWPESFESNGAPARWFLYNLRTAENWLLETYTTQLTKLVPQTTNIQNSFNSMSISENDIGIGQLQLKNATEYKDLPWSIGEYLISDYQLIKNDKFTDTCTIFGLIPTKQERRLTNKTEKTLLITGALGKASIPNGAYWDIPRLDFSGNEVNDIGIAQGFQLKITNLNEHYIQCNVEVVFTQEVPW